MQGVHSGPGMLPSWKQCDSFNCNLSVAWREGEAAGTPFMTGAAEMSRLLATLGRMKWAITKVCRGTMQPSK